MCPKGGLKSSNLAQKNILSLAMARHKNLFCTILPLFSPLRLIGVLQEVYCIFLGFIWNLL